MTSKAIGLTGGIGSGKSLVLSLFEVLGAGIYIADIEAKLLMTTEPLVSQIKQLFGTKSYISGKLNRQYIAAQVFADKHKLDLLNAIVHPAVRKHFEHWLVKQNAPYCVQESAILFESNIQDRFVKTILVTAPESLRIQRVMLRDNISREAVQQRIANQWADEKKKELADFIIYNDGKASLIKQILEIHTQLLSL